MAKDLGLIAREVFYFFSAALAAGALLELCWPNILLLYFNWNYLLALWLLSAIVMLKSR